MTLGNTPQSLSDLLARLDDGAACLYVMVDGDVIGRQLLIGQGLQQVRADLRVFRELFGVQPCCLGNWKEDIMGISRISRLFDNFIQEIK